jgi:hypothetical protein
MVQIHFKLGKGYFFNVAVNTVCRLSHEILRPAVWPEWMRLGLSVNRLWFENFHEAPSIFGSYFKFWCASYQTFSEIRRISEKD